MSLELLKPCSYMQRTPAGGPCVACGLPPEHWVHTHVIPGCEEILEVPEEYRERVIDEKETPAL